MYIHIVIIEYQILNRILTLFRTEASANRPPTLEGMKFVLDSKLGRSKEDIEKDIKKLGGSVGSLVTDKIAALISTKGIL